jgi:hypothetical protein
MQWISWLAEELSDFFFKEDSACWSCLVRNCDTVPQEKCVVDAKTLADGLIAHICSVLKQMIGKPSGNVQLNGSRPLTYLITNCHWYRTNANRESWQAIQLHLKPTVSIREVSCAVGTCRKCVSILCFPSSSASESSPRSVSKAHATATTLAYDFGRESWQPTAWTHVCGGHPPHN